jgi:leucyl aminopeptidase
MAVTLTQRRAKGARPIHAVARGRLADVQLDPVAMAWAKANSFSGEPGRVLLVPGADGSVAAALVGLPERSDGLEPLFAGVLARTLPEGDWYFDPAPPRPALTMLGLVLGGYAFTRYGRRNGADVRVACPPGVKADVVQRMADAVFLTRDLINTPANDMGPEALEKAARQFARSRKMEISSIVGDALLKHNFPMIHAVGRGGPEAPRLIDMAWGPKDAPKLTLVGKGVTFDTGGLDIKPASSMLLMKKDMGGAANVLGLAHLVVAAGLKVRLRVLLPVVENSISASSFRPGDVLPSRKGVTVEIGNTDAEGRLILADALAYADEAAPDLLIDMATLTGAARVALGPDLPPFFTDDERLAAAISAAAVSEADPVWRLPLWHGYENRYPSKVADINNVNTDGYAGAIVAALFLRRFVSRARSWAHFDVFGWSPLDRPHCTTGGEAQAIRALNKVLADRYGT